MKADSALQQDVVSELTWEPSIRDEDVAVAVKDGVVTLAGTVDTYAQRYAAERAAARVKGVRAIANELMVKLSRTTERSDSEIAHAALNALKVDIEVPDPRIRLKVANGWITLNGDLDWNYQRLAAERAVRYLTGVKGIVNSITLAPAPTRADVRDHIEAALTRQAEIDASHVMVDIDGHTITLRGKVRSLAEKNDAASAAWAASGVTSVVNHIEVDPPVFAVL
jgi:osmotically-inducible protein OsmY